MDNGPGLSGAVSLRAEGLRVLEGCRPSLEENRQQARGVHPGISRYSEQLRRALPGASDHCPHGIASLAPNCAHRGAFRSLWGCEEET